jgi:hydrogenase maturation protein HypF
LVDGASFKRVNRLRPFPLPGGEKAVRDPRHSALGLLHEADLLDPNLPFLDLSTTERSGAQAMLRTGFNCPRTSSMGRLFDAVSALLGLCRFNHFEGEAAMRLESACERPGPVRYPVSPGPPVDWRPMLEALLADRHTGTPAGVIASRFHLWVVDLIAWVAGALGQKTVVMSGGCFQNSVVLESAVQRLKAEGFEVYWPHRVPPNDGGIALGQAAVAACVKPFSDRPETD